jgi:hypothetical protein
MARQPLPLGSWGTITTEKVRPGVYRSLTRYRDADGHTRRVSATGSGKPWLNVPCGRSSLTEQRGPVS